MKNVQKWLIDMLLQDIRICDGICLYITIHIVDLHIYVFELFYFQSDFQALMDL
jgi:hypothetical protein